MLYVGILKSPFFVLFYTVVCQNGAACMTYDVKASESSLPCDLPLHSRTYVQYAYILYDQSIYSQSIRIMEHLLFDEGTGEEGRGRLISPHQMSQSMFTITRLW